MSRAELQRKLDEMQRLASRLAGEVARGFQGEHAPGLSALWIRDHLAALVLLEHQFKAVQSVFEAAGRGGK